MARGKLAELFYDLRAESSGLSTDLKDAENQLGKLSDFVLKNPVASVGALGAAFVGVAIAGAKMADEVEQQLRKVEARVPGTTAQVAALRDTIRDMSTSGPHGQAELASAAAEIARQGVGSLEEVQQRLAAVTTVADATGEDMNGIIAGLDQSMDMFGLSSKDAEGFLAKLYATAANRMPITDLFAAFQGAAPVIRDFGIDADTAMRAIGALLERGMSAKQAASELKQYASAGADGAAAIRQLAASYQLAANPAQLLHEAAAKMNGSAEASWKTIKNNLNAALIDLGSTILPVATAELRGFVGLLDVITGKVGAIKGNAGIGTLITGFTTSARGVTAAELMKQVPHLDELARNKELNLGGLNVAQLDLMTKHLSAAAAATKTSEAYFGALKRAIADARVEAEKLATAQASKKSGADSSVRTADQILKDQEAAKKRVEEWQKIVDKASAAALEAGKSFDRYIAENGDAFWEAYKKHIADVTDSIVETTEKEFKAMRDRAAKGGVVLPVEFEALERRAIAAAAAIREAASALDDLDQSKAAGKDATADQLERLTKSAAKLKDLRSRAAEGTDEWKKLGDELKKVEEAITRILDGVADAAKGTAKPVQDTTDALIRQADALQRAIEGALELAQAFGLVDQRAANSLRAVSQIATSIPALQQAWSKRNDSGAGNGMAGVVGAALPIAGAVASVVSGFISAAKAAKEHADALRAARAKLTESLTGRVAGMGLNDTQKQFADIDKQRKEDLTQVLDLLIQQKGINIGTRDDFLAKDQAGQRATLTSALATADKAGVREALRAAIAQFDLLAEAAEKAKATLEEELAAKRQEIDGSLAERRARLAGNTAEADAMALLARHEQELTAARQGGIYTAAQLAELEQIQIEERKKAGEEAQAQREKEAAQKARDVARQREDLQTRINAADGETPEEKARRREIEKRREIEDAMANSADAATIALIQLAQAADDAAAAQAAATAAARDLEDLDVELLRAQGKTAEADAKAFDIEMKRRYEDAVTRGESPEYLAKLAAVIEAKRAEREASLATASATDAAGTGGGAASAQGSAFGESSVQQSTLVQTDRLIGLTETAVAFQRQQVELLRSLIDAVTAPRAALLPPALPSSFTVGAGGQVIQIRVQLTQNFYGPIAGGNAGGALLGQSAVDAINVGLAQSALLRSKGQGQVTR